MNQVAIDYLQKNKDLYAKEVLVEKLKTSGFSEGDIEDSIGFVYNDVTGTMMGYNAKLIAYLIRRGIGPAVLSVVSAGALLSYIIDDLNILVFVFLYLPFGGIILTIALVAITARMATALGKNDLHKMQLLSMLFSIILPAISMVIVTMIYFIIVGRY
jgi:hypothetical protein